MAVHPSSTPRSRLQVIGAWLFGCSVAANVGLRFVPESEWNTPLELLALATLPLGFTGAFFHWRGRQYAARSVARATFTGSGPTVLYLRAFRADASTWKQVLSSAMIWNVLNGLATEEENLTDALRPFGNLVAIGQPGELLPVPGAARMYVSHEWQSVVLDQMRKAALVVIRAATTSHLFWELKQAMTVVEPAKLLLFVPRSAKEYSRFRAEVAKAVNLALPPRHSLRRFSGIFWFAQDWTPIALPLVLPPLLRRPPHRGLRATWKYTLQPVFERNAVPWKPLDISGCAVALVVSALLFVALVGTVLTSLIWRPG